MPKCGWCAQEFPSHPSFPDDDKCLKCHKRLMLWGFGILFGSIFVSLVVVCVEYLVQRL